MPRDSKQKRRARRAKHQVTLFFQVRQLEAQNKALKNFMTQQYQEAFKARVALCALLAQHGGELTLTRGTLKQALDSAGTYTFNVSDPEPDPEKQQPQDELRVTLVEGGPPPEQQSEPKEEPKFTIRKVADDEPFPGHSDGAPSDDHEHDVSRFHDEGNPNHD